VPKIISWRKLRFRFDWTLMLAMLAVIGLGLLNLWSGVREHQYRYFTRQLSWVALGMVLFLAAASFDYRRIARLGYVPYALGIASLLAVKVAGTLIHGARRWFDLGAFNLQPSELMKVFTIVALAKYVNDTPALEGRSLRHLAAPCAIAGVPVLLIALQPDLGTALIFMLTFVTIMLTARLKLKTLAGILALGLLAVAPIWEYVLYDYQRNRILAFIDPSRDPATAWQPQQALNAVGSGRLIGKGFLQGTQIRLRAMFAQWTDFPFAVWAEEWGFVGCFLLLLAYSVLLMWILKIGREARDRFGAVLCVGTAGMIFWQVVFNIGMVIGVLPVAGVTLPLFSYGGSSLLTIMIALGLVMNVSIRRFAY
jgi:rod shape determining protein RodA